MSSLQFYHDKHNGYTYAVDVAFTREDLLETVHHFDQSIAFVIGKSTVHPNDNYCKATGREVSTSKMKPVMLYFTGVHRSVHCFKPEDKEHTLLIRLRDMQTGENYMFRVNSKSEKVHFIRVDYSSY